jgi:hypothetical protein
MGELRGVGSASAAVGLLTLQDPPILAEHAWQL